MKVIRESDDLHNDEPIYCPSNAYGDCPYCDIDGRCYIADPTIECDDFSAYWKDWEDWENS